MWIIHLQQILFNAFLQNLILLLCLARLVCWASDRLKNSSRLVYLNTSNTLNKFISAIHYVNDSLKQKLCFKQLHSSPIADQLDTSHKQTPTIMQTYRIVPWKIIYKSYINNASWPNPFM